MQILVQIYLLLSLDLIEKISKTKAENTKISNSYFIIWNVVGAVAENLTHHFCHNPVLFLSQFHDMRLQELLNDAWDPREDAARAADSLNGARIEQS